MNMTMPRVDVEAECARIQDPFLRDCWRIVAEHYNHIWYDIGRVRWPAWLRRP